MDMDEDVFDESKLFSGFDSVQNGDENPALHIRPKLRKSSSLSELDSLKQENLLLKKLVHKIGFNPIEEGPFANILFYDNIAAKQAVLEDFICHVASKSAQNNTGEISNKSGNPSIRKNSVLSNGFAVGVGRISDLATLETKEYDMSGLPVGSVQYFDSFCLDSFGSDIERIFPNPPNFDRVYFKTLPEETGSKIPQQRKKVCFNCDGDHKLDNCTKRLDHARISMKRNEFMEGRPSFKESRYHEDQTKRELYQHLKPGVISDNLRLALGMDDHDLPPFIYRMRILGYPPGWLPGDHNSGIVMYGKEGREEERNESSFSDPEKFVQYPGFNVPVQHGKFVNLNLMITN